MMNTFYLPILAIILMLAMLSLLVRNQKSAIKAIMMFLIVFIAVAGSFVLENLQAAPVAKAVDSVKQWLKPLDTSSPAAVKEDVQPAIIPIKDTVLIDAPILWQMPELPRGCEVTSLAMLLQDGGITVDKLALAEEIRKNPAEYRMANGKIYFGNPHEGFVGNMYTYTEPGLGVYHEPIAELAEKYLPGKIKDMTGADFLELKIHLSDGRPVWIITNTLYKKIDESYFQTWYTPNGKVRVTSKEHSVLVTGYDQKYVFFNDPLTGEKNKKAPIRDFVDAWVQMGRQAITFLPD